MFHKDENDWTDGEGSIRHYLQIAQLITREREEGGLAGARECGGESAGTTKEPSTVQSLSTKVDHISSSALQVALLRHIIRQTGCHHSACTVFCKTALKEMMLHRRYQSICHQFGRATSRGTYIWFTHVPNSHTVQTNLMVIPARSMTDNEHIRSEDLRAQFYLKR